MDIIVIPDGVRERGQRQKGNNTMAIKLTPKEMAMRGLTPTGEKLKPEEEQKFLFLGGIDPKTGQIFTPSVPTIPTIPTVPGVSSITASGKKPVPKVSKQPIPEKAKKKIPVPGVPKQPIQETGITIPISKEELQQIAEAEAKGQCVGAMRTYYTPKLYKLTLKGGDVIYAEALDREGAKKKAIGAGYKVAWVGSIPSGKVPKSTARVAVIGIDRYKDAKGNYDIISMAQALDRGEVTSAEVRKLFGSEGSHEVSIVRDVLTKLEPYKTGDGYLLSAALADRAISTYEAGKVFSQGVVDNAVANRAAAAKLSKYKGTSGNYDLVAISAALQVGRIKEDTIDSVLGKDATQAAKDVGKILRKLEPYKSGDDYFLADALKEKAITEAEARQIFSDETIAQSKGMISISQAFSSQALKGKTGSTVSGKYTAPATPTPRKAFPIKEAALIAADIVVPYVYVVRHWKELPVWERALWIALDTAFFIIPMAGAGVRGARGVAVAAKEAGRLARLGGALKNVGREAFIMLKAPVGTIMHPVAATKQGARDFRSVVENVLRGKKIPEAVLTTTEGTVRLSITKATSVDEFMRARDALIKAAAQGDTPIIILRDKAGKAIAKLQLQEAPLMRELKGGVVHTTPWGEQFRAGLRVEARVNMPLAEQGLFISHEPLPRFAKQSAFNMPVEIGERRGVQTITTRFGANQVATIRLKTQLSEDTLQALAKSKLIQVGDDLIQPLSGSKVKRLAQALREGGNAKVAVALEDTVASYRPIFRIMSPDKAKDIIASGKTYRGAVEMEAKLPLGTKIPPPKQILVTRIGPESTEVQIWLDKALSAKQILKLKAEGLLEVFRQPFRFPLKISGVKGKLTPTQIKELTAIIRSGGNPAVARNLERAYQLTRSSQRMTQIASKAAALIVTRSPQRAIGITRPEGVELVRGAEWLERSERPAQVVRTRSGKIVRKPARVSRTERTLRAERAERARRTERTTREGRLDRATRAERTQRTDRPVRGERVKRVERPVRGERPIRPTRPERPVRPIRPVRPTKPTRPFKLQPVKGKRKKMREGPALVTWKQGMYYISVYPPFRTKGTKPDVAYSRHKPPGAIVTKGKHSPRRSLKSIGRVPPMIELPMGAVTARVRHGRKLTFSRRPRHSKRKY